MPPTKIQLVTADLHKTQAALKDVLQRTSKPEPTCRNALSDAPNLGNHILFLFVGPHRELITLHTDLLPEKTKAYLNARAGAEPFHQLADESPEYMRLYRLFLYTGKIFTIAKGDKDEMDGVEHNNGATMDAERTKLMECYILGAHLHDERFRNAAIDALVHKVEEEEEYPTGLARDVYQWTSPGDRLRKLIVDFHVWKGQGMFCEWLRSPHEDADGPPEFLADVAAATKRAGGMQRWNSAQMPWESALCNWYHEHVHTPGCVEVIDLSGED